MFLLLVEESPSWIHIPNLHVQPWTQRWVMDVEGTVALMEAALLSVFYGRTPSIFMYIPCNYYINEHLELMYDYIYIYTYATITWI